MTFDKKKKKERRKDGCSSMLNGDRFGYRIDRKKVDGGGMKLIGFPIITTTTTGLGRILFTTINPSIKRALDVEDKMILGY